MYTSSIGLILGFHGCGRELADRVIMGTDDFNPSEKPYDWLGNGIYFWDRDPIRAYEFAIRKRSKEPSVVGAVIYPKKCLDTRCRDGHEVLRAAYDYLCEESGTPEERNSSFEEGVPLRRDLDCIVVETACRIACGLNKPFDTVIGTFFEGREIYPGAGMRDKTHTQICVKDPDSILGYFRPKREDMGPSPMSGDNRSTPGNGS